ncbi:MAG: hypothetical protein GXP16_13280, partial [Gammaproteobacteria bacterium]|nr:hypothetical protein [Gammaproteobacteria bacterium]
AWQQAVQNLVTQKLQPYDQVIEETGEIPEVAIQALRHSGLFGMNTPKEFGGLGMSMLATCLAVQELAKAHISYYYFCGINLHIGSKAIEIFGSELQQIQWLPKLASGEAIAAFALTESEAGSDAAGIRTTASRDGLGYRLNGVKRFVTNAPTADLFTVFATLEPGSRARGMTAFVVEAGTPGMRIGERSVLCGGRGSQHATVHFENCYLPASNCIGKEGQGLQVALCCLDAGRTIWAAYAIGVDLLNLAVAHLRHRHQFGKKLIENQGLQWRLADLVASLHAARLVAYEAAWRYDTQPESRRSTAAMSKLIGTEMACKVADEVMQFFGGLGYSRELSIERHWRDVRVSRILDGTSEILRSIVAKDLDRWIVP